MIEAQYSNLEDLLKLMLEKKASDLHIAVGSPPMLRVDGSLVPVGSKLLDAATAKKFCFEKVRPEEAKDFEAKSELDTAIELGKEARFRVNLYFQKDSIGGAFRHIPTVIPTVKQLGLPEIIMKLTQKPRGLVLVTGPTGSGKSTTLAAMLREINETRNEHLITIEDPIEFVHETINCQVMQREVGRDTPTFASALKRILRQDPDIVLIGEMRDIETIGAAITISETGHLVFGTLHTNTAVQTINRIIDVFPAHQQPQIRTQLSFILEGVISQQLVPKKNGGRALVQEILIPTVAIRNMIREDKVHQIYSAMQTGQATSGMQTMNQSLAKLFKEGIISKEEALGHATELEELKKLIGVP